MDINTSILSEGLISYFCFLIVLTFHEAGHAWMAWKRGDDTARLLGRISLNPLVHIDLVGTVVLPLLGVALSAAGSGAASFIIGWGKPVPFNPAKLKHRLFDGMLIALAGPAMNVVVAQAAIGLFRVGHVAQMEMVMEFSRHVAQVSMYLCFFNLLPIPPLDGSHVLRYFLNWSEESFLNFCRYGIFIVIIVLQFDFVWQILSRLTYATLGIMGRLVGL